MYRAEICSPTELLSLAAELQATGAQNVFASPFWLGPLIEDLAPRVFAEPFGVVVRETAGGAVAGMLPLVVAREHGFRTVRFADFGVTDYAAPLIGPAFPRDAASMAAFRAAAHRALSAYDLVRFERLLPQIGGRANPLAAHPRAVASRMNAQVLAVPTTVRDYVSALGRKARKEVERCQRNIAAAEPFVLERAQSEGEIGAAFTRLEALQAARWSGTNRRYRLDQPAYARFYRSVLERGVAPGFADLFTLFVGETPVGTVFGIRSADRFIVLRIASDDARWGRFSPGRITLLAVMEHLVDLGVRTFDLGIGDYEFKRRLGAQPQPLADLTVPLSWTGAPLATGLRAKAFLGRQPALKSFADRIRRLS